MHFTAYKFSARPFLPLIFSKRKWVYSAVSFLLFIPSIVSAQQTIYFHSLQPVVGSLTGNPASFAQDKYGFVWIGTSYGLVKYDGYTAYPFFKDNNNKNSLGDNFVTSLYSDTANNLIYASSNEKLSRYNITTNSFYTYANTNSTDRLGILDMVMDTHHTLWIGTRKGLFTVKENSDNIETPVINNNWPGSKLIRQLRISGQYLYAATDSGLYKVDLNNNTVSVMTVKNGLANNFVLGVCSDSKKNTWVISDNKNCIIQQINSDGVVNKTFRHFVLDTLAILENNFSSWLCDKDDNIWIATISDGLTRFNTKTGEFTGYPANGLTAGSLVTRYNGKMFLDSKGIVWLSNGQYGATFFNPAQQLFNNLLYNKFITNTLPESWSRCAAQQDEDHVWLGTVNGVSIYNFRTKHYTNITNGHGQKPLHNNSVRSLFKDSRNNIWIGTAGGLNRYNAATKKIEFFGQQQNMPNAFIWSIIETKGRKIVVGCTAGAFIYDEAAMRFTDLFAAKKFQPARKNIGYVFEDSKQRLWLATTAYGIYRYDPSTDSFMVYSEERSPGIIFNNRINNINEDKDGTIWIASYGGLTGINTSGSIKYYRESIGAVQGWVSSILFDKLNRIWMTTDKGLAVLDPATSFFKTFDLADGLLSNRFIGQRDIVLQNGNFLFANEQGFVYFNPLDFKYEPEQFKFYVSEYKRGDSIINTNSLMEPGATINLSPTQNFISLHFAAADIMAGNKIFFRYKMEGFDQDWMITQQRDISYTNIPGGDYTFRYTASTNPLKWEMPEKTIHISIAIPFYKRTWFYWLMAVAVLFVIYCFYKYRVKNIRAIESEKLHNAENETKLMNKQIELVGQEQLLSEAKLTALRSQMNPHFIFNALNSIQQYILQGNVEEANKYLSKFSKLQRDILHCSSLNFISLEKEIEILNAYLQLEQLRFGDTFSYTIHVADEIDPAEINIPPMMLQPFAENAIWHGLMPKTGEKKLAIDFELLTEDILLATIRDNGIGRAASAKMKENNNRDNSGHESKGMSMVNQRLLLLQQQYDKPFEITVSDITDQHNMIQGTVVAIKIFMGNK